MTIDEVTEILKKLKGKVSKEVDYTIRQIISLSYTYHFQGANFSFDTNIDLRREVNALLLQLSDSIIHEIESSSMEVIAEEDQRDALVFLRRDYDGADLTERVDAYSSRLRYLIEGYICVSFADKRTMNQMLSDIGVYLSNPYQYDLMRKAFTHPTDFSAGIVFSRGYHFGKGIDTNPEHGLELIAQNSLLEAYHFSELQQYDRNGAIGYRVHRGSGFDCEYCDSLCVGVHPLDEQVLPAHPRCMCWTTPVYPADVLK